MSERQCKRGHDLVGANLLHKRYMGELCATCMRARKAAYRKAVLERLSEECECGNSKKATAEACNECSFLDGTSKQPTSQLIIATLRVHGELTVQEIAQYVYGRPEGWRSCMRAIAQMLSAGRVQRRHEQIDVYNREFYSHFTKTRVTGAAANQGRYVYRLTAPARLEIGRAA